MYVSNPHSYTHLILPLGIVRDATVWVFITSEYPGIHDIGRAILSVVGSLLGCNVFRNVCSTHACMQDDDDDAASAMQELVRGAHARANQVGPLVGILLI